MTAEHGLEVVIPRRFDRGQVPALVEGKRDWIERASVRVGLRAEARRRRLELDPPTLPTRIVLPAVGEEWAVEYRPGPSSQAGAHGAAVRPRTVIRERPGRRLLVTGDLDDAEACRQALSRWLRRRARRALIPWVADTALRHRLEFGRVSVRQQRTRWASCSRQKTISLNARLLFLQRDLVEYVVLHELCHTVEMNHSARFWARLQAHDPDCQTHRLLLRAAAGTVPTWVDHGMEKPGV
ncbi:MAG: M48 family metallopeptidase [Thermoleophilia bacterium]|nr:M48 family metallopeptidase [Thermoleophilia bacterium]